MIQTERDGIVITDIRRSGLSPADALKEAWQKRHPPQRRLLFKKSLPLPEIATPDLRFDAISYPQISPDQDHFICVGYDEQQGYLLRDDQILYRAPKPIKPVATNGDFSKVAFTSGIQDDVSLHIASGPDQVVTLAELEKSRELEVLDAASNLERIIVRQEYLDGTQSVHFVNDLGQVKTAVERADEVGVLTHYSRDYEKGWYDRWILASTTSESGTRLNVVDGSGEGINQVLFGEVLPIKDIEVVKRSPDDMLILWKATSGEQTERIHHLFLNDQLLAKSPNRPRLVGSNDDLSRILITVSYEKESTIIFNGQTIEQAQATIEGTSVNDDVTFAALVLNYGHTRNLLYLTPKGCGKLSRLAYVWAFGAEDNLIWAKVDRGGANRDISITVDTNQQTPKVTETAA